MLFQQNQLHLLGCKTLKKKTHNLEFDEKDTTTITKKQEEVKTPKEEVKSPKEEVQVQKEEVKSPKEEVKIQQEEIKPQQEEVKTQKEEVKIQQEEIKSPKEEVKSPKENIQQEQENKDTEVDQDVVTKEKNEKKPKKQKNPDLSGSFMENIFSGSNKSAPPKQSSSDRANSKPDWMQNIKKKRIFYR